MPMESDINSDDTESSDSDFVFINMDMCIMWSRRVPRHCMPWKFCMHSGWATEPSNLSTMQSSSLSWCMASLHDGALRVPVIDSKYRHSSVVASIADLIHQIYLVCQTVPWRWYSLFDSIPNSHNVLHLLPLPSQALQHYSLLSRRHNLLLFVIPSPPSLIDRNFLAHMLHIDSHWS